MFLSGDLPPHGSIPVRYDIAHEMEITGGGQTAVITAGLASEDGKKKKIGRSDIAKINLSVDF